MHRVAINKNCSFNQLEKNIFIPVTGHTKTELSASNPSPTLTDELPKLNIFSAPTVIAPDPDINAWNSTLAEKQYI